MPLSARCACSAEIDGFHERLQQILRDHEKALYQLMGEAHRTSWSHPECTAGEVTLNGSLVHHRDEASSSESMEIPMEGRSYCQIHEVVASRDIFDHDLKPVVTALLDEPVASALLDKPVAVNALLDENEGGCNHSAAHERIEVEDKIASYVREHDKSMMHYFRLDDLMERLTVIEPVRVGRLARVVQSKTFENVVFGVIALNCLYIIFETNQEMKRLNEPQARSLLAVDIFFASFYVIELLSRLQVHRLYFFCGPNMSWNLFDFTLVAINTGEHIVSWTGQNTRSLVVARAIRLLKVGKVLRAVRLMYFLTELRLMVMCLLGSFWSLIWSFVVLFFVALIFAIILVQDISNRLKEGPPIDKTDVSKIYGAFGSVEKAVFTLFLDISGGQDWNDTYNIVQHGSIFAHGAYISYILIMWLSVTNIISSMFIERALKLARPEVEEKMLETCKDDLEAIQELKTLFQAMDLDDSKVLTTEEFHSSLNDVRIQSYFELRGISMSQADTLFGLLTKQVGIDSIDIDTFVTGCLRMKGYATNIDVIALHHQSQIISDRIGSYADQHQQDMQGLNDNLCALSAIVKNKGSGPFSL